MKTIHLGLNRKCWLVALILMATPLPALAGQYQHCYPVTQYRMVRDPGYHPQAYEDGYREGVNAIQQGEQYEPRSSGGEFARGFDDGYYGRPRAEQRHTIPDHQEAYQTNQCRTYSYNDKESINQILQDVMTDFQHDLERDWNRTKP